MLKKKPKILEKRSEQRKVKTTVLFTFPDVEDDLVKNILQKTKFKLGDLSIREFPDKETFVQIFTDVEDRDVVILCGLDSPNRKITPLIFLIDLCKELGANKIQLVAPYLGYMRQDKRFHDGEAITSKSFAKLLNNYLNGGITIDPHLHRYKSMDEIYTFPFKVLHASDIVAKWIKKNIKNPVLIGPDEESKQWVADVAKKAGAPFIVLQKIRTGDKQVEISLPNVDNYLKHTPVLVDDIISTARTMIGVVEHLNDTKMQKAVCIGIHAVFAGDGYEALKNAKVADIVTCNTIRHKTNKIDVSEIITKELLK